MYYTYRGSQILLQKISYDLGRIIYPYRCILTTELRIKGHSPSGKSHVMTIETPFVTWNHVIKQGYWCMPCCILEDNIHPKMKVCSSIPTHGDICKQHHIHGRCGIEFDP